MNEPAKPEGAWSEPADREALLRELDQLRGRVTQLEQQLVPGRRQPTDWRSGFYASYYATTGFMLGMVAAALSLLLNVVGSMMFPGLQGADAHPLHLVRVYLTFPLGERALSIDSGLTLAIGCCLYLGTGAVLGMLFNLALHRWASRPLARRLALASALAVAVWLINFYGILSWLQPLLFHGNWIVELVPWWVAALTHLVFGWTMALVYPWGEFNPYRTTSETL
ncbi:MAG: hypothetical protein AB7O62_20050 [Pirellulales bacterium]